MHDHHAIVSLIERITSQTGDLEHVAQVRIRAGAALSPEALHQSWEMLTQDSVLEGCRLVIEERRDERECPACGTSWIVGSDDVAGHLVVCPTCGMPSSIQGSSGIDLLDITDAPVAP